MGNPHAVIIDDGLKEQDLNGISDYMQNDKNLFPESVNVGFMKIKNKKEQLYDNIIIDNSKTRSNKSYYI